MTISAVLSAHNHERFILQAVNALIPQVDQVVLVDDGSSDATTEIIKAQNWPTVLTIFHEKPYGVSESYNEAIAASSGEIIMIQGADDVSEPNRAQIQSEILSRFPDSVAYSLPTVINSEDNKLPSSVASEFDVEIKDRNEILNRMYFTGNFICAPSVSIRRSLFESTRGFLNGVDSLQDFALWLELLNQGVTFQRSESIVRYRKHLNNLSAERMSKDAAMKKRFAVELDYVLEDFLCRASQQTLSVLATSKGFNLNPAIEIENFALKCMLRISHKNPDVKRRGVAQVFAGLNQFDPNRFLAILGIQKSELTTLSLQAGNMPTA